LECLDELIADLGGADAGTRSKGPCGLLLEHLQAARRDLLGSMPGEYALSLRQAVESASCISDKNARIGIRTRIRSLIASEVPKRPPPAGDRSGYVLPLPVPVAPAV
jgi:hypothetical protein